MSEKKNSIDTHQLDENFSIDLRKDLKFEAFPLPSSDGSSFIGSGDSTPDDSNTSMPQPVAGDKLITRPAAGVGKLFLKFPNGKYFVCTGFAIAYNYFMTAAHCVYSPQNGGWVSGVSLIPSYPKFSDQYIGSKAFKLSSYNSGDDFESDFAIIKTKGKTFNNYIRVAPLKTKYAFASFGYPADGKYNPGNQMYKALGFKSDGKYFPNTIGMRKNDMTGGASGGPWLTKTRKKNDYGYACGINSYRILPKRKNYLCSPIFGEELKNFVLNFGIEYGYD